MKWLIAAAIAIAAIVLIVGAYEFSQDMRLGGMPRNELEVATRADCPDTVFEVLAKFAASHGFKAERKQASIYENQKLVARYDTIDLSRWNGHITAHQHRQQCDQLARCYWVYVDYKGWLWWTDLSEADRLTRELIAGFKNARCTMKAELILTTQRLR